MKPRQRDIVFNTPIVCSPLMMAQFQHVPVNTKNIASIQ